MIELRARPGQDGKERIETRKGKEGGGERSEPKGKRKSRDAHGGRERALFGGKGNTKTTAWAATINVRDKVHEGRQRLRGVGPHVLELVHQLEAQLLVQFVHLDCRIVL